MTNDNDNNNNNDDSDNDDDDDNEEGPWVTNPLQEQECVPLADVSYYEPDEEQCDK